MDDYRLSEAAAGTVLSPGLVIFTELLEQNLDAMVRIAGNAERLRPHCKTHKMPAIVRLLQQRGIHRHKCATIAEAEMLAQCGVKDVLIAYQLVGPNVGRLVRLMDKFPDTGFTVLIDHPRPLEELSAAMDAARRTAGVLMDVDSGMNRTGVRSADSAKQLYEMICTSPGIVPKGLQWYDGHNHQSDVDERRAAIEAAWPSVVGLRDSLMFEGYPVPRIVVAGTGSFPIMAEMGEPNLELSPGTTTLYDAGYHAAFEDLPFRPAAAVLTRVVSCNREGFLTLDCGHKSLAPDQPAGRRAVFPALPDAREVHHTEEHLVIWTAESSQFQPGDVLLALPRHICPTVNLHQWATVISNGEVETVWPVTGRDRVLTV
jgi:D-threonine aldolase